MSIEGDICADLYYDNLESIWDSFLPSPDIRVIKNNGDIEQLDQTIREIAQHYLFNVAKLAVSLAALPLTFTISTVSVLAGSVISALSGRVTVQPPSPQVEHYIPEAFGFANSGFQDGAIGTDFDPSSLKGMGVGDWNKILARSIQRVTENGQKIGEITHGITLKEGERIEDLFVNIMDYPYVFANLLKELGCNSYRISLERSVLEPEPGKFNEFAIQKYRDLFQALQDTGVKPWVTFHHFTNPQWVEDQGDFLNDATIDGFVRYCEEMVDRFPMVQNWMTFNEPGIRGLEAYVRGEHPPQKKDILSAARLVRNLLIAHTKVYASLKAKNPQLNIGITHQWLKFLPFGWNPIEKITAFFFTNLIHTPIFNFFKNGVLHIKVPFRANVQLRYESESVQKIADFLGIQAYGFPRIKVGWNGGQTYPGAADKVNNFVLPFLHFGFTAGSTCGAGGSMQYFGPPDAPNDLKVVFKEAFSIPKDRIPEKGVTETGSDAKRMDFGETEIKVDNAAQAQSIKEIFQILQQYPLICVFVWTLNRHCEWLSGGMPHLGLTKLKNEKDGSISYEETDSIKAIREIFQSMEKQLASLVRSAA